MIAIHLKSALRNLYKHKSGSVINILGLSIGMAAAVLIFMWVQNEVNFDNYHPDGTRIFHVGLKTKSNQERYAGSPLVLGDEIKRQIPEVDKVWDYSCQQRYSSQTGHSQQFF